MRIYLIGFMGSGKTALGKKLASHLQFPFFDIDEKFENQFKITINDFFMKYGEEAFRKLERKLLHETLERETAVISTGGGTPCFFDNMDFINKHGTSVFMNIPINMAIHRLKNAKKPRPLLENILPSDFSEFLQNLYLKRLPFYQQAHILMDTNTMDAKQLSQIILERESAKGLNKE
jgi:shikimate kinase